MNILHLSNTPLSNAPENLASCQRHSGLSARVLLHRMQNRNKVFVGGELWTNKPAEELEAIFEEADVIHFHNFAWTQEIFKAHPKLRWIARQKKRVIQYHSPRDASEQFEETIKDEEFAGRKLIIAQYHVRQYPECEHIVPNLLPLHESIFRIIRRGKWTEASPLQISYAPSNAHLRGWDYKGHNVVDPTMRYLQRDFPINYELIMGVPYEECLMRKSYSHIGIEEFFTGSYHLSFLEYMALQVATVGFLDPQTEDAMSLIVGKEAVRDLPYIKIQSRAELEERVSFYAYNTEAAKQMAEAAHKWIHTHWNSDILVKMYTKIYSSI